MLENHNVGDLDPEDPIKIKYKKKDGKDPKGIEKPELERNDSDEVHAKINVKEVYRIGDMYGGYEAGFKD